MLVAERLAAPPRPRRLPHRDHDRLHRAALGRVARPHAQYVLEDAIDIQWKLYEMKGRFYIGRPKDGSIRMADLPPFLVALLTEHLDQVKGRQCTCREKPGPDARTKGPGEVRGRPLLLPGPRLRALPAVVLRRGSPPPRGRRLAPQDHPDGTRPVLVDADAPFPGGTLTLMAGRSPR